MIIIPEITRDSPTTTTTITTTTTRVVGIPTAAFTINQLTRQIYSLYQRCLALLYSMLYTQRVMMNKEEMLDIPIRSVLTTLLVGITIMITVIIIHIIHLFLALHRLSSSPSHLPLSRHPSPFFIFVIFYHSYEYYKYYEYYRRESHSLWSSHALLSNLCFYTAEGVCRKR